MAAIHSSLACWCTVRSSGFFHSAHRACFSARGVSFGGVPSPVVPQSLAGLGSGVVLGVPAEPVPRDGGPLDHVERVIRSPRVLIQARKL